MNWREVPIPSIMKHLALDRRGLPIPYVVFRDEAGTPHFTINDTIKVHEVIRFRKCSICGGGLPRGLWFVGGPMSALHEHGAYLDPPLHWECASYALQVCPYLAAPKYAGRLDDATIDPEALPEGGILTLQDNTMIAERPDVFVAGMTTGYKVTSPMGHLVPKRPWKQMRFFRHGVQLSSEAALHYCAKALANVPDLDQLKARGVIGQYVGKKPKGDMP